MEAPHTITNTLSAQRSSRVVYLIHSGGVTVQSVGNDPAPPTTFSRWDRFLAVPLRADVPPGGSVRLHLKLPQGATVRSSAFIHPFARAVPGGLSGAAGVPAPTIEQRPAPAQDFMATTAEHKPNSLNAAVNGGYAFWIGVLSLLAIDTRLDHSRDLACAATLFWELDHQTHPDLFAINADRYQELFPGHTALRLMTVRLGMRAMLNRVRARYDGRPVPGYQHVPELHALGAIVRHTVENFLSATGGKPQDLTTWATHWGAGHTRLACSADPPPFVFSDGAPDGPAMFMLAELAIWAAQHPWHKTDRIWTDLARAFTAAQEAYGRAYWGRGQRGVQKPAYAEKHGHIAYRSLTPNAIREIIDGHSSKSLPSCAKIEKRMGEHLRATWSTRYNLVVPRTSHGSFNSARSGN